MFNERRDRQYPRDDHHGEHVVERDTAHQWRPKKYRSNSTATMPPIPAVMT